MRRKFFLFFLLILAIPVVAYIGFPWYAKPVLNLMLGGNNLTINALHVDRPNWNSIFVRELSVDRAGIGQITVTGARIHFRGPGEKLGEKPGEKFRGKFRGKFSEFGIFVEEMTVALSPMEENVDQREKSPQLADYLPENFLPRIPTVSLTVHAARIDRSIEGQQVSLAKFENARLTNYPDGLDLSVIMIGEKQHVFFLSVTPDNKVAFAINPAAIDRIKLQLTGLLGNSAEGITFKSAVDADFRQPIYFNTRLDETLGGFVGRFRSETQSTFANLPVDELLNHPIIDARGFVEADMKNTARGIKLKTATAFRLNLDGINWEANLAALPGSRSGTLMLELPHDNKQHRFNVILPEPIKVSGTSESKSAVNAAPNSIIDLRYLVDDTPIGNARFSAIKWNGLLPDDKGFNASLNADIDADGKNLLALTGIDAIQLDDSALHLSTDAELQSGLIKLNIKDDTKLLAGKVSSNNTVLNSVDITIPPREMVIDVENTSTSSIPFTLTAKNLISHDYQISPVRINGETILDRSQARFNLINEKADLRKGGKGRRYKFPPYQVTGELDLQEQTLGGVNLQLLNQCDKQLLSATWKPNGLLSVITEHTFSKQESLRRWLNLQALTADIQQGELTSSLEWDTGKANAAPRINVAISQTDITGSLGIFDNVQLLLSTPEAKSNSDYTLEASASNVNIGTDITDFKLHTGFTHSDAGLTARIHEVSGKLLGGRAFIENQQWTLGQPSLIDLHLENLDLAELVKTQNIESITTTGQVTGVIPIKLDRDGGFSLASGKLSDINGGTIRYQSALTESEGLNEQLQLTLDVLRNFNYEVLNTQIAYDDGNLLLQSNILGSNPDVAGGQKIDLNLNTEVNLKSAFQAMRLQAGLEAQVENLFAAGTESSLPFCQQPL